MSSLGTPSSPGSLHPRTVIILGFATAIAVCTGLSTGFVVEHVLNDAGVPYIPFVAGFAVASHQFLKAIELLDRSFK